MAADPLLHAAVVNNARWCDAVCRSHCYPGDGATTYTTDGITGILNVFKSGIADDSLWAGAVRAIARVRPGLPIVGYERGEDLTAARQAGFTVLGPLRIWARGSAVS